MIYGPNGPDYDYDAQSDKITHYSTNGDRSQSQADDLNHDNAAYDYQAVKEKAQREVYYGMLVRAINAQNTVPAKYTYDKVSSVRYGKNYLTITTSDGNTFTLNYDLKLTKVGEEGLRDSSWEALAYGELIYSIGKVGLKATLQCVKAAIREGAGSETKIGQYLAKKAPEQVTPGTRILTGQYIDDLGRVQPWTAHYDEYGRLVGRTDFNAANKAANIPSTHYHTYEWGPGKTPLETGSHIPGEFQP